MTGAYSGRKVEMMASDCTELTAQTKAAFAGLSDAIEGMGRAFIEIGLASARAELEERG